MAPLTSHHARAGRSASGVPGRRARRLLGDAASDGMPRLGQRGSTEAWCCAGPCAGCLFRGLCTRPEVGWERERERAREGERGHWTAASDTRLCSRQHRQHRQEEAAAPPQGTWKTTSRVGLAGEARKASVSRAARRKGISQLAADWPSNSRSRDGALCFTPRAVLPGPPPKGHVNQYRRQHGGLSFAAKSRGRESRAQETLARIMHARHTLQQPRPQRRPVPANLIAGLIKLTKVILTPTESRPRLLEGTHTAAEGAKTAILSTSQQFQVQPNTSRCCSYACAENSTLHASRFTPHASRLTLRAASDSVHVSSPESGRGRKSDADRESRRRIQVISSMQLQHPILSSVGRLKTLLASCVLH